MHDMEYDYIESIVGLYDEYFSSLYKYIIIPILRHIESRHHLLLILL
jgi:hypothetical protein